jgi:chaperonin cofactor prefoldin
VIALVALGGNFFVLQTENSQMNKNNSALSSQIGGLQKSIDSLQTAVSTLGNQLSAQAKQVSVLQNNLTNVRSQLANMTREINSNRSVDLAFQGWVYYQLHIMNATINALTDRLLAIQVPLSTLVIVGDSYNNATNTFTFNVQNTLSITVYAQINAQLYGTTSAENCNGVAGSYISQVYTFTPMAVTVTQLVLGSGLYNGCASNPVTNLNLYYMAGQSTAVSVTYAFNIVPAYNHP